jgi:hypothetical protein
MLAMVPGSKNYNRLMISVVSGCLCNYLFIISVKGENHMCIFDEKRSVAEENNWVNCGRENELTLSFTCIIGNAYNCYAEGDFYTVDQLPVKEMLLVLEKVKSLIEKKMEIQAALDSLENHIEEQKSIFSEGEKSNMEAWLNVV